MCDTVHELPSGVVRLGCEPVVLICTCFEDLPRLKGVGGVLCVAYSQLGESSQIYWGFFFRGEGGGVQGSAYASISRIACTLLTFIWCFLIA